MRAWGIGALALALLAVDGARAEDALERIQSAGVLKVGTEEDFAPFDFLEVGKHVGFDVDLFTEIGHELKLRIEFVTLAWDRILPGLEGGRFDVVAGPVTITTERLKRYRFTPPVAEATVALLKRSDDSTLQTPQDIAGKPVGAGQATQQLQQLRDFALTLPGGADVRTFSGYDDAYAALAAGRVAAVANSWPNLAYEAHEGGFRVVTPPFGPKTWFAFVGRNKPDSMALMKQVDAALLKIKHDGRLAALQRKWFGLTFDTPDSPEP